MPSVITRGLESGDYRLYSIGKLKKGTPKINGGFGNNLSHFRFESKDPYFSDIFEEAFGTEPEEIPVILPYRTAVANFDDWHKEYATGKNGNSFLKRKCDGKTIVQWMPPDESAHSFEPKPCEKAGRPGCGCSLTGLLSVYIRDPAREWCLPGFNRGPVTVETHSKNDTAHLAAQLEHFEDQLKTFGADLAGARFVLKRVLDTFGTPLFEKGSGKPIPGRRGQKTDWLIKMYPDEEWLEKVMAKTMQVMFSAPALPLQPLQIAPTWAEPLDLQPKAELVPLVALPTPTPLAMATETAAASVPTAPSPTTLAKPVTQNSKLKTQNSKLIAPPSSPPPPAPSSTRPTATSTASTPATATASIDAVAIRQRFEAIQTMLGCPMKRIEELAQTHCKKKLEALSEPECSKLRNIVAVDWAEVAYGEFGVDAVKAIDYFKAFWQECDRQLDDAAFFRAWKVFLNANVFSE